MTPEAICVLEKGIICRSNLTHTMNKGQLLSPILPAQLVITPLGKDALFAFYSRDLALIETSAIFKQFLLVLPASNQSRIRGGRRHGG